MVTVVLYGVGKLPVAVFLAYAYMSYLVCLLSSQTREELTSSSYLANARAGVRGL